jgi:hypothetical protein
MMCLIYVILVALLILRSGMYRVELLLCMFLIIPIPNLSFTLHQTVSQYYFTVVTFLNIHLVEFLTSVNWYLGGGFKWPRVFTTNAQ